MLGVGGLFRLFWSEFGVIALTPVIGAILSIALKFCVDRFLRLGRSQLCLITWPRAVCTVGCIELAPGDVHFVSFRGSQLRSIAGAPSIFAGGEIALLLVCGDIAGFEPCQFGPVARQHAIITVGQIPLVIGYGQRNRFLLC